MTATARREDDVLNICMTVVPPGTESRTVAMEKWTSNDSERRPLVVVMPKHPHQRQGCLYDGSVLGCKAGRHHLLFSLQSTETEITEDELIC